MAWSITGHNVHWAVLLIVTAVCDVYDLRRRRIPNFVTIPLLLFGVVRAGFVSGGPDLRDSLLGCVVMAFPYLILFSLCKGGAGDAKLMGALGAWVGFKEGALLLAFVAGSGIVMAVAKSIAERQLKTTLRAVGVAAYSMYLAVCGGSQMRSAMSGVTAESVSRSDRDAEIPYGVAIFSGVCIAAMVL